VKAFIVTAAIAFALLALAHVARLVAEGPHLLKEPVFLLTSVGSVCICVWAIILLRRLRGNGS
jgi:hypothetical protein